MNPQAQAQAQSKQAPQQNSSLIRVDQVPKLPHLSEQEKIQTQTRVQQLWDIMNNSTETEIRRRQAHQALTMMSQQIMQAMRLFNEQKQSQQAQQARPQAPVPPPPQRTQTSPPAPIPPQAANSNVATTQFLPEVQQQLDAYQFVLPPAMASGTKEADNWLKEAKNRLGSALQRMQQAKVQKANLKKLAMNKHQQGGLSAAEQSSYNEKILQFDKYTAESQSFLEKFREQQTQFRMQRAQLNVPNNQQASQGLTQDQRQQVANAAMPSFPQQGSVGTTSNVQTPGSQPTGAVVGQDNLMTTGHIAQSTPQPPINTPAMPQMNIAQPPLPQHQPQPQPPQMQSPAGPGAIQTPLPNHINQGQQVPPQSQPMNSQTISARPNFGGPHGGPQRSMTEPALSAIPGYALDQSSDGAVLSKKKLRELIVEVLGANEEDQLTAGAEDFVDDFVDDIISQGCKIAKLRGSTHLDARDVQVVLERQYNIRIPGFSTDELRVARRPQPSAGWTQKTNAIQSQT